MDFGHKKTLDYSRVFKAATGFEPVIKALQAHALPLGYAAEGRGGYHAPKLGVNQKMVRSWKFG